MHCMGGTFVTIHQLLRFGLKSTLLLLATLVLYCGRRDGGTRFAFKAIDVCLAAAGEKKRKRARHENGLIREGRSRLQRVCRTTATDEKSLNFHCPFNKNAEIIQSSFLWQLVSFQHHGRSSTLAINLESGRVKLSSVATASWA
jgi:hypothetical protein